MFAVLKTFLRQTWLVLGLACGLSAALAAVDAALRDRIADQARHRLEQTVLQVVPGGTTARAMTIAEQTVYRVEDAAGELRGWATVAEGRGFQDRIRVLVGLSADGRTVTGLTILDSSETPGLGDRIQQPAFRDQFAGQPSDRPFARTGSGGAAASTTQAVSGIHAVTGATVSSLAVINAVNEQLSRIRDNLPGQVVSGEEHSP